jgi:twitching motility protein PilT
MFEKIPGFGRTISQSLAARLRQLSMSSFLPVHEEESELPPPDVVQMLPMDFIIRQNILPLHVEGSFLHIGFVHDPKVNDLRALRRFFPSMQLKLMHIDKALFDKVLQSQAGVEEWSAPAAKPQKPKKVVEGKALRLNRLLKRMVAEGASDLHLSAARAPHWRIDGEIRTIQDAKALEEEEVLDILNPVMDEYDKYEFKENNDAEFAYSLPDVARFRINLFRDHRGVGAVIRVIPSTILSIEQLGLPPVLKKLCEKPKGLVLVTGPTGAGKSTTLAAMIGHINKTRRVHVITVEDPIEFVHQEELALINQRQVGHHTNSYATALRAALREDPDILLIGELRDRETIALALEAANTGSLVFGTLQTATAISTVTRIIDFFPPDQQDHVRSSLADCLQGVVSQTLCRRIGGGRVVAAEVLIVDHAVRHLIHEEKTNQIVSTMQTQKAQGNRLLNEELAELVKGRRVEKVKYKVEYEEALSKTPDREDLARRLHRPLPKD